MNFFKRAKIWLFIIGMVIIVFYTPVVYYDLVMALALVGVLLYYLVRQIVQIRKSRQAAIVKGQVVSVSKQEDKTQKGVSYIYAVSFISPVDQKEYQLSHTAVYELKLNPSKELNIQLDERKPENSVVMDNLNRDSFLRLFQISILLIALIGVLVWRIYKLKS